MAHANRSTPAAPSGDRARKGSRREDRHQPTRPACAKRLGGHGTDRIGVAFVAADAPFANHFTLHLLSAAAQEESRLISARMKDVRAEAKASGRIWNHVCNFPRDRTEISVLVLETRYRRMRERYAYIEPIAKRLREAGFSLSRIATHLNERGLRTQRGTPWTGVTALYLLRRVGAAPPHRKRTLVE